MPARSRRLFAWALGIVLLSGAPNASEQASGGARLAVGQSRPVVFSRGATTTFLVDCGKDDVVRITIRRPAPFVIAIVDPTGATLRTRGKIEPLDGPETVTFVTRLAGTHRVELRARGVPDARGAHEMRLDEHRPAGPGDARRAEAERQLEQADALRVQSTAATWRQALEVYERARIAWRALGDARGEADAVLGAALSHRALSENEQALEAYTESLGPRRASGDLFGEAFTLQNIAVVHRSWGDLAAAEEFYGRARDVAARHGDERAMADALNGLARVAAELGDLQRSLDLSSEALPRSAAIGDRRGEAYALTAIGNAHAYAGDFGRAREFYSRALAIRRALDDAFGEANALANLGAVAIAEGDAAGALAKGREGLAAVKVLGNRRAEAEQLELIGLALQLRGAHAEAVAALEESASINTASGDRRHQATALEPMAVSLVALGRIQEARDAASRALALRRGLGDALGEAQGLAALADVEAGAGDLPAAATHATAALDAFESQRVRMNSQSLRATFVAASHNAYDRYIDVHMQLAGRDPASAFVASAFHASERARARGLLDALGDARAGPSSEVDESLQRLERNARRKVDLAAAVLASLASGGPSRATRAGAEAALDEATFEYEQVDARIRVASPRLATLTHATPLTLADVQRDVLDDESLLLEYALGRERSYVWAITKHSMQVFTLPGREVIDRAARAVHESVQVSHRPGRGAAARLAAAEMSRLVLSPVAHLFGDRRLLVVADGALHVVPFPVLPRPGSTDREPLGSPLIDRHEVVMLPSASVVPVVRAAALARPVADRLLAVFADPVFRRDDPRLGPNGTRPAAEGATDHLIGTSFERLRFARREAERIAGIAGAAAGIHLATDFDASREAVLASSLQRYRIVHFATHALVNTTRPSLSGIVLSLVTRQGEPQDGFLRLRDVYNLRLGASLVVLSACQTALGQQIHGEGIVGLTRGFMHAGVPSVVASLWDVRDEETSELMTRFYERLLGDRMPPAAALRAAQRSMLADPRWSAPSNWAGFMVHGEWRSN